MYPTLRYGFSKHFGSLHTNPFFLILFYLYLDDVIFQMSILIIKTIVMEYLLLAKLLKGNVTFI